MVFLNIGDKALGNMKFSILTEAVLLKRYHRYLADCALNKKDIRTLYCPNNGAMRGCDILGSRIWFSTSFNTNRKFPYTWEVVEVDGGHLVGVNTLRSVDLIREAILSGTIDELKEFKYIHKEAPFDNPAKRVDLILRQDEEKGPFALVEVETVTLGDEIHRGFFPDCAHTRALRNLYELLDLREKGHRAILLFCVQHTGIEKLFVADHIDKQYGVLLREAIANGVEVYAYRTRISVTEMAIETPIPVIVPERKPSLSKPI